MSIIIKNISNLIENQFPSFYKEEGEDFIKFVEVYYEWLEQENSAFNISRNILDNRDIDTAKESFIKYFIKKYMSGLPDDILGNTRYLQKHILDLYRSKGSHEGLKLLFKLLYNEDIDIYTPSVDILKASDNKWNVKKFIQISNIPNAFDFQDKIITGIQSLATAYVVNVVKMIQNGEEISILYLENIKGDFVINEYIRYENLSILNAPYILGSPSTFTINLSSSGFKIGDEVFYSNGNQKIKCLVNELTSSKGTILFDLVKGGIGYTKKYTQINITNNTAGSDASFEITDIDLIGTLENFVSDKFTSNILSTSLNGTYNFTNNPSANINTPLPDIFEFEDLNYGTISFITTTNPGHDYDGNLGIDVIDPMVLSYDIIAANGDVYGNNAIITGSASFGSNIAKNLKVVDSGKNFKQGQLVTFYNEDKSKFISCSINLDAIGIEEGYWENTNSFLSYDKFLRDNYYYQDFSYEIRSSKSINQYFSILKEIVHPAGTICFGRIYINDVEKLNITDSNNDSYSLARLIQFNNGIYSYFSIEDPDRKLLDYNNGVYSYMYKQ